MWRNNQPMVVPQMTYDMKQHDGTRLFALMSRAGISKSDLAAALNVSPTTVGARWIGEGKIARERIKEICRLLRCSADELLGIIPIMSSSQVAESLGTYNVLDSSARALLNGFSRLTDEHKKSTLVIVNGLAATNRSIRPNG